MWGSTGDEDIVNVGVGWSDNSKNSVHEQLECLCSIPEAKRHSHKLKQAEWDCDSGLGYICGGDWNLMIRVHEFQYGDDRGTLQC